MPRYNKKNYLTEKRSRNVICSSSSNVVKNVSYVITENVFILLSELFEIRPWPNKRFKSILYLVIFCCLSDSYLVFIVKNVYLLLKIFISCHLNNREEKSLYFFTYNIVIGKYFKKKLFSKLHYFPSSETNWDIEWNHG